MSDEVTLKIPLILVAFLDTARNRKDAVRCLRAILRPTADREFTDDEAAAIVEAYYAQHGGKPWLRRREVGGGSERVR